MPLIREKIKSNNQDTYIKINLGIGNHHTGHQQEIDSFTEETKIELINPVIDNEVSKFEYDSAILGVSNIIFEFSANGSTYFNTFLTNGAGFSTEEIASGNIKLLNSFFIMDFYDSFDNNTQTRIFTIYNTQILDGEKFSTTPIPKYRIHSSSKNQFFYWYVPKSFTDAQTGLTATLYTKFSFYNAKSGKVVLFTNKDIVDSFSPEKMYFKAKLSLDTMKWRFDFGGLNYPPNAIARQIPSTTAYTKKVNDAINNFQNIQQNPATGVFDSEDGTYDNE